MCRPSHPPPDVAPGGRPERQVGSIFLLSSLSLAARTAPNTVRECNIWYAGNTCKSNFFLPSHSHYICFISRPLFTSQLMTARPRVCALKKSTLRCSQAICFGRQTVREESAEPDTPDGMCKLPFKPRFYLSRFTSVCPGHLHIRGGVLIFHLVGSLSCFFSTPLLVPNALK